MNPDSRTGTIRSTRTARTRAPMDHMRKTALAAGLLYLATFVFSIPAAFGLYEGVLDDPGAFVLGAGSDASVLWGGLFEVLTALAGIGTAVVLYPASSSATARSAPWAS